MNGYSIVEIGFASIFFAIVFAIYNMQTKSSFDCWDWIFTTLLFGLSIYIYKFVFMWYTENIIDDSRKITIVDI
jgi:hypothetical protein